MVISLERGAKGLAYGPADATATPSSLAPVKSRMVTYLSGAGLPRLSWKKSVRCGTDSRLFLSGFQALVTLTLSRPWMGSDGKPTCITHRRLSTYQISLKLDKLFCGRTIRRDPQVQGHVTQKLEQISKIRPDQI